MSLFPWKPFRLAFDLEDQIDKVFAELIYEPWGRETGGESWQPDVDLLETEDAYLIVADLPGVLPANLDVQADDHSVVICGERQTASLVHSAQGVSLERRHGRFCRRFQLEHAVDADAIEMHQEQGVYHIRLPKKG